MSNVSQWNTTDASNTSTAPDGAPEGIPPSSVNDIMRAMMGALARWYSDTDGSLTSTGSSNAYVLSTNSSHAALADQSQLTFRANFANTGAATLAVDGLDAKSIKKNHDVDLATGDIEANQIVTVVYNATDDTYELISSTADDKDLSSDGYVRFDNGLIIQWGTASGSSGTNNTSLPLTFPNAALAGIAVAFSDSTDPKGVHVRSISTTQIITFHYDVSSNAGSSVSAYWIVVGH